MFGIGKPRDPREAIHREHQKLYRSNTVHGIRPSEAYERALLQVIARHSPDHRGRPQDVHSEVVRSEAIPFLLLSGGKAVEVLAEYLTWRDTGDESRLGYLRAMLAVALQTRQRWPRSVLMTLSGAEFERVAWFDLLRPDLQTQLRAIQAELRKRALQHLQAEAAMAL